MGRCKEVLGQLASMGYITLMEEGGTAAYTITKLGRATYKGEWGGGRGGGITCR